MKAQFGAETEASKICQRILAEVIAAKASNAVGAWKAALPTFVYTSVENRTALTKK